MFNFNYWRRFHLPNVLYLLVLLAVGVGAYFYVQNTSIVQPKAQPRDSKLVDGYVNEVQLNQTGKDGRVQFQGKFDHILHHGDDVVTAQKVNVIAGPNGQPPVSTVAENAKYDMKAGVIEMQGEVSIQRDSNDPNSSDVEKQRPLQIKTQQLQINMQSGTATTDQPFVLMVGGDVIQGQGFVYDYELRDLVVGGQSNGTQSQRIRAVFNNEASIQGVVKQAQDAREAVK